MKAWHVLSLQLLISMMTLPEGCQKTRCKPTKNCPPCVPHRLPAHYGVMRTIKIVNTAYSECKLEKYFHGRMEEEEVEQGVGEARLEERAFRLP